jgi:uncharacterized protein YqjF (DUF2071 family)
MGTPEVVTADAPPLGKPRIMRNDWRSVSFLHWAVEPSKVAGFCPRGTQPDTLDGSTYVGLVAFEMANVGLPHGPSLLGRFLETNVRLYSVDQTGRRGVVFLSLDTNRLLMIAGGRTLAGVPYRLAEMTHCESDGRHRYTSVLRWPRLTASTHLEVRARDRAVDGALERFLTARWGLHVRRFGRTWYLPNAHPAWSLRDAELLGYHDGGLLASVGLGELARRGPDHVMFSSGVPALFGLPVKAETPRRLSP